MAELVVRAPLYLTRFECIGPSCEDHCCGGWQNVDVDAATFERLRHVEHPKLKQALQQHVARNPEPGARPDEAALIAVSENGCCPFFTMKRLCAIQGGLGERLLPATCDTFPRQATSIDGVIDITGRFACPEIVRLALLEPDGLDLVEVAPDRRLRERGRFWLEVPWTELPTGDPRHHYHHVRALCVELLRRREVSLEAKLQALGLALGALSGRPGIAREEIDQHFADATARLAALQRDVDTLPPGVNGPPALLLGRLRTWIGMPNLPSRYRACLDRVCAGLGLPADADAPLGGRVAEAYFDALRERFLPYVRNRPHVLANAIVNQIYTTSFPFHPERSFFDEYALLVARYVLLKLHLVGAAAAEGALTDELVVETVQAFDKYPDSPDYWQRTLNLLRRDDALDTPGLSALLLA
jgi:lysine-N-methylase